MTLRAPSRRAGARRMIGTVAGIVIAIVGLTATAVALVQSTRTQDHSAWILLGVAAWYLVGAAIVSRRRDVVVGWLFVAIGLLWTTGFLTSGYAELPTTSPGPALTWASWYSGWFWVPANMLPLVLILVFPTGRVPTPAWRPLLIFVLAGCVLGAVRMALAATLKASDLSPEVSNPIGIPGLARTAYGGESLISLWTLTSVFAVVTAFVVRFRRSKGVERQQLKWMALLGVPIFVAGLGIGIFLSELGFHPWGEIAGALGFAAIPFAALMAITRSQLYEIDRIVSRTASYAVVTGALLLVYAGVVTSLTRLLPDSSNTLTVATATLAAAAAFRPLLSRVQKAVDRRFDRARYDGERTVDAFAGRLRDEVDADQVSEDLLSVVRDTVQPAGVGLWLRGNSP